MSTGVALFALGTLVGMLIGSGFARHPEAARRVELSMPPGSWPVALVARDMDGREVKMRFACRGEWER